MSLYGSGRREGILSVIAVVLIAGLVHLLGALLGTDAWWHPTGATVSEGLLLAVTPAIAGVTSYRFLKSLRRSRYASFLGATAYSLSPWLCAIAAVPREQLAAALAPLALEAACRTARPDDRRRWLPWAGLLLAAPFVAGITTVGALAVTIAVLRLISSTFGFRRDIDLRRHGFVIAALLGATLLTASWVLVDIGSQWLLVASQPTTAEVLAAHRVPSQGLDAAAFLRLSGPIMLLFAVFGLLRGQRHVSNCGWVAIAIVGAAPTFLVWLLPELPALLAALPFGGVAIPAATFWLTLVATTVLGTAGLDDFLEMPVRRRFALPLLLALVVLGTPAMLYFTPAPRQEWPLIAAFLALTVLLLAWRGIGMLRFKNVLGVVAIIALLIPAVQVLTIGAHPLPGDLPAAPLSELRPVSPMSTWDHLLSRPRWHYAGVVGALLLAFAALLLSRRSTNASPAPARAKSAIAKNAPPPKSS